ncbi:hypothetical protein GQ457_02G009300 [Hibiscus cannabinus]
MQGQNLASWKPDQCQFFRVVNLMDVSNRCWREDVLCSLFPSEVVSAIVAIPIGGPLIKDELIWALSKDGNYTVKSGYHFIFENNSPSNDACSSSDLSNDKEFWSSIWSLQVPPKIKSFIWRASHNILPTNGNLNRKFHGTFGGGSSCPRCGDCVENMEHTLFFCPFALTVWKCSGFGYEPTSIGFPGFGKWWKKLSSLNKDGVFSDGLNLLAILCWNIWKSRNSFVFSSLMESPIEVWNRAFEAYEEFSPLLNSNLTQQSFSLPQDLSNSASQFWTKPPLGVLKVNCDAAFDRSIGSAAIACVVRDDSGCIIKGEICSFPSRSVSAAEAIAIRKGVLMAISEGWEKVIFESDNIGVINGINSGMQCAWESSSVVKDILSSIALHPFFSFQFVKRECNLVADWFAKACLKGRCPLNWFSQPPPGLLNLL